MSSHRSVSARSGLERNENLLWVADSLAPVSFADEPTHFFLRLPDGREYLFPLQNGKVFRASLSLYPAQAAKARLAKKALQTLSYLGVQRRWLSGVHLAARKSDRPLYRALEEAFSRDDFVMAISFGTPGPHRKPVVQVLSPAGQTLGYAKVGWNEETARLVNHEAQVLRTLTGEILPFRVPAVLYVAEEKGRSLCVQSSPPEPVQPARKKMGKDYLEALNALAARDLRWLPLRRTSFWRRFQERKQRAHSASWKNFLERATEIAIDYWEGREVPCHLAHGDFAPWNALWAKGGLYLYDWEYALEGAPAGYDLFHFLVQVAWLVERKTAPEMMGAALKLPDGERTREYMRRFITTRDELQWLFYLYLLDQLSLSCLMDTPTGLAKVHAELLSMLEVQIAT